MRFAAAAVPLIISTSIAVAQERVRGTAVPFPPARADFIVDANGALRPGSPAAEGPASVDGDRSCGGRPALPATGARDLVRTVAQEEGFFPDFVMSLAEVASGFDASTSASGRFGLMGLRLEKARALGLDPCDPEDQVRGAIGVLRDLHGRYRNPFYVLAAYHAGETSLLEAGGLPADRETLTFVARVMDHFYDWPSIAGAAGVSAVARAPARGARGSDRTDPTTPGRAANRSREGVNWASGFVANFD